MIWFFLAGWVAGAVFMVMYAHWWMRRHMKKVTYEEAIEDLQDMKEEEKTHE